MRAERDNASREITILGTFAAVQNRSSFARWAESVWKVVRRCSGRWGPDAAGARPRHTDWRRLLSSWNGADSTLNLIEHGAIARKIPRFSALRGVACKG